MKIQLDLSSPGAALCQLQMCFTGEQQQSNFISLSYHLTVLARFGMDETCLLRPLTFPVEWTPDPENHWDLQG